MAKTLTITLSDEDYEALQRAASRAHVSPEELATATVANHLPRQPEQPAPPAAPEQSARTPAQCARDEVLAIMRAHGHLVDPSEYPRQPGASEIPPRGTPEREVFEDELGRDLTNALERSGLTVLDLIERR